MKGKNERGKRNGLAVKDKVILGLCDNAVIERSHVLSGHRISRWGNGTQGEGVGARENLHRASNHFALEYLRDPTGLSAAAFARVGCVRFVPLVMCIDWGVMIGKATGIQRVSSVV